MTKLGLNSMQGGVGLDSLTKLLITMVHICIDHDLEGEGEGVYANVYHGDE